jgi:hypothetical protein
MAALPATGSTISIGQMRSYFGLSGTVSIGNLGNYIFPAVTSNVRLSATFGGWQNPNWYGTATGLDPSLDQGPGVVYGPPDGTNSI